MDGLEATRKILHVRIGMHSGEVEIRGEDVEGIAVNIGAGWPRPELPARSSSRVPSASS